MVDVLVVGAGPAGLMSAGVCSENKKNVLLVDSNEKPGKKLYITGKGRCNLTNIADKNEFLNAVISNPQFLHSAISRFGTQDAIDFFERYGCKTQITRGGRVFPESNKASDVTNALVRFCKNNRVEFLFEHKVVDVCKDNGVFCTTIESRSKQKKLFSKNIIIATGGLSYPATGSKGDGFLFAKSFGHSIIEPKPALVAINLKQDVSSLEGLSLKNVSLIAKTENKILYKNTGEMLFTRRGISGPLVLTLSSKINRLDLQNIKLEIDFKIALGKDELNKRVLRDFEMQKNKTLNNVLLGLLPKSLVPYFISVSKINQDIKINSITKVDRNKIVDLLKALPFDIDSLGNICTGVVTAGGVNTKEIDSRNMQSKIVDGLYFAGEVVDVDAKTGGYNIQIALSTGFLAGSSIL